MGKDYKSERDRCSSEAQKEQRGSRKERKNSEKSEKNEVRERERELEEASKGGEKSNFNSPRQIQNPLVFHPHEKTRRESPASARAILAFHTDRESK